VDSGSQYYAVARSESRTSADQFAAFCEAERLPTFRCDNVDIISPEHVEAVFAVQESRFDVTRLREVVRWKLRRHSVRVFLGTKADTNRLADFDWVIVAGYANNNAILDGMGVKPIIKQYEVCEKPVVQMPSRLRHKSIVVIDGPFMCMDPIGVGSQHIWGHVTYGVHATTEGYRPDIPASLRAFVNRGIVTSVPNTSFERFRTDGGRFVPDFLDSRHVGSMFTLKVVPFDVDATDERPTDVMCVGKNVIVISSGKLSTAVSTAGQIRELLADKDQQSRRGNREPKYGAL
jgi:hypothetical protein